MRVTLRQYLPADSNETLELFRDTVHSVNAADYSAEQLDAWAPPSMNAALWNQRILRNDCAVVAEQQGTIVGIGTADTSGYFDLLYVHKDYQRMGIATSFAEYIEEYLSRHGVASITTEASITAVPFFENRGYVIRQEQKVECRGQLFTNYKMEKEMGGVL